MSLQKLLLSSHSKETTNEVVNWVGDDPNRFNELMNLVLGSDIILAQRAAWSMSYIVVTHPMIIFPYLSKLLLYVQNPVHPAIKRNTFRFLKEIDIPEKFHADELNTCFQMVKNPKEPIAVICFAYYTLLKLAKKYPDIKNEILLTTELHQENKAAGFNNALKKVRKELNSI